MSVTASERAHADAYAGPGHSFPLYKTGDHLRAAWDLAGHAADPSTIRERVIRFAREHGLTKFLPAAAKEHPAMAQKASTAAQLLAHAYAHETGEGDTYEKRQLVQFASDHGMLNQLPDEAHGMVHDMALPHDHGDGHTMHAHPIKKAYCPVGKSMVIEKAWGNEDGTCTIEGWVSTNDPDQEKDVVEPEAFLPAMPGYVSRRMPLSSEHQLKALPIGHGQRVALVREGHVLHEAAHPTDAADFEHFPGSGTGVYGRFIINDPVHASQVLKGNIGGFSWVGNLTEYEPLPTGGKRFLRISPWLESTVAAYPINGKAILTVAKAFEAELAPQMEEQSVEDSLVKLLEGALAANEAEQAAAAGQAVAHKEEGITKADLEKVFAKLGDVISAQVKAQVEAQVQKAATESRQGVGRLGAGPSDVDPRESDPAAYAIRKATAAVKKGEELSGSDKDLIAGITVSILSEGLLPDYSETDED